MIFSKQQSGQGAKRPTGRPDAGPSNWFTYIAVDDVDARAKTAVAAGAELMMPLFGVPAVGRIGLLKDPTGAIAGWMTPSEG